MLIGIIAYVIIAILAYFLVFKNWDNKSNFEKIWYSIFWIAVLPLYAIHAIHK